MSLMAPISGTPYRIIVPVELPDIAVLSECVTPDAVTPDAVTSDIVTPDTVTPDNITPYIVTPDIVTFDTVTPDIASAPFITFGAGGNRYRNQNRSGQCPAKKSPTNAHDRSFQSDCNTSDNCGWI